VKFSDGNHSALGMDQIPAPFARAIASRRKHESKNDPTKNVNWKKPVFTSEALEAALRRWTATSFS
jgi:hypothetical protein